MQDLSIRLIKPTDVESIVSYFFDASSEDLIRMGIDPTNFPPKTEMVSSLTDLARQPEGSLSG